MCLVAKCLFTAVDTSRKGFTSQLPTMCSFLFLLEAAVKPFPLIGVKIENEQASWATNHMSAHLPAHFHLLSVHMTMNPRMLEVCSAHSSLRPNFHPAFVVIGQWWTPERKKGREEKH